jgi:hypothetical protein
LKRMAAGSGGAVLLTYSENRASLSILAEEKCVHEPPQLKFPV